MGRGREDWIFSSLALLLYFALFSGFGCAEVSQPSVGKAERCYQELKGCSWFRGNVTELCPQELLPPCSPELLAGALLPVRPQQWVDGVKASSALSSRSSGSSGMVQTHCQTGRGVGNWSRFAGGGVQAQRVYNVTSAGQS